MMSCASAARAGDPLFPKSWPADARPKPLISDETRRLVEELGSDDFATRERASQRLQKEGPAAFDGLRIQLAGTTDPEIAARTSEIMEPDLLREAAGASAAARLAVAAGEIDNAQVILQIALNVSPSARYDYAALRALRQGKDFDAAKETAALARLNLTEAARNETAMHLSRAAGRNAEAADLARKVGEPLPTSVVESMMLEARDYAALEAIAGSRLPRKEDVLPVPTGRPDLIAISRTATEMKAAVAITRPDDFLDALKSQKKFEAAFVLLASQWRLREAMALPVENAMRRAECLLGLGFRRQALEVLFSYPPGRAGNAGQRAQSQVAYAAALHRAGLDSLANRYEGMAWESAGDAYVVDVSPLVPERQLLLDLDFWRVFGPRESDFERFEYGREIVLRGVRPEMPREMMPQVAKYIAGVPRMQARRSALIRCFNALAHAGEFAAAEKLVRDFGASEDGTYLILVGDWALEHDRPAEAVAIYRQLAPYYRADASLMYATGLAMSRIPESKAQGEAMMAYAPYLILGSNLQAAHFSETLRRFQGDAAANAWADGWLSRFASPATLDLNNRLARRRAAAEARGDIAEALALQTQSLIRPSRLAGDPIANVQAHLAIYERLRALDALQRGDMAVLAEALRDHLSFGPPDIELLGKALPLLRAANRAAAEAVLSLTIERITLTAIDCPEMPQIREKLAQLRALQN